MDDLEPLLILEGIYKAYPGVNALSDVDFAMDAGEVVSIVGQNGAGKSTLVNVLGGVVTPDKGSISIAGKMVHITNPAVAEELGIGYVHQEPTLVPNMTVAANMFLNRELVIGGARLDFKKMKAESSRLIGTLGFNIDPDRLVEDLTLVEKEVVEIAKALLFKPRILILDEVTAPLNAEEVAHLFEIMAGLKEECSAIIFISHRLQEVMRVSDRIVVLRDGKNAGELRTDQSISEKDIIALMLGQRPTEIAASAAGACPREEVRLSVQHLSKAPYFEDVSFTLYSGESLGFAGLKGSGITELLKTVFGALKKDQGEVFVGGRQAVINHPGDAIKNGIGMLTNDRQKEGLALKRSVEENITISTLDVLTNGLGFFRPRILRGRALSLVQSLNIRTSSLGQEVVNLSGGNQQKVVLAKWLLRQLNVVIADEPTRGVDVRAKGEIYELLTGLKHEGKAVIVSSPEIPELLAICDRILVVDCGGIVGEIDRLAPQFNERDILGMMHGGVRERRPDGVLAAPAA
jgi:ABC-type sugar transport system ATPase subunit